MKATVPRSIMAKKHGVKTTSPTFYRARQHAHDMRRDECPVGVMSGHPGHGCRLHQFRYDGSSIA
jgi:hypothetical protein